MPNPFAETKIAWTNELDGFQNAFSTLVSISGEFVKEFEAKYAGNHEFTMQEAMVNVLADNYSNKEIIDTAFDGLTDAVNSYQSVQTLLDSDFFYGVAETKLAEVMQVEEIKIPHNIAWIDNGETEGELRIFLNSIRAAISKGVLEFVMSKPDLADINNVKELVNILDSSYKDTTLLNYLFNSNLLYYASSIMMLNYKIEGFEILVPDASCTTIESIKFITRDEILNLINCLPTVLNEINDLEEIQNDPIKIVNILQKENVRIDIIKSDILTATAAKTINTMALQNPDVSEMLVIPNRLLLDGTKDQENLLAWINTDGELDNLLSILPLLDLEGLMAQDADAIIELTKMSENDFNTVVSSDIIHYSFTKILNKLSTPEFSIMIPGDVYDSEYTDAKVIKSSELHTMLKSASSILIKDKDTGALSLI